MNHLPWGWKLIGGTAILTCVVVAWQAHTSHLISKGDAIGFARAKREWARAEAAIKANVEAAAAADAVRARAETAALQSKFDKLAARQQKDRVDHENDKRIAVAAALAGNVRLSIAVTVTGVGSALPEVGASEGAATGAELLPETAAAVLGIAGKYGQLVRDYNSLLERFDALASVATQIKGLLRRSLDSKNEYRCGSRRGLSSMLKKHFS